MGHHHHHHHHHEHHGKHAAGKRGLFIALGLTVSYMLAEVIGGLWSGSLALLADAGHMLSDSAALALSLAAMWLAARPANAKRTYGFHRSEVLAALINAVTLLVIAVLIVIEAYARISAPPEVQGLGMFLIASGGLVMNLIALFVLRDGKDDSLNVRGAWLHVATDALGSIGAMASGLAVWKLGWRWADPVASVIIALLVAYSAWALLRETLAVLMENAPENVDVDDLQRSMRADAHVNDVHDLHVWTITSGLVCLSAHVVTDTVGEDRDHTLVRLTELVQRDFGIDHITIQLETPTFESCVKCR